MQFSEAVKSHAAVQNAARLDPELARELWLAVTGQGDPAPDTYAEAASDLAPAEHASLLASGETPAAYAFACLHGHAGEARGASPYEQRELARAAWDKFCERADKAGDVEHGLGFDQSLAWETTREWDKVPGTLCSIEELARLAGRMKAQISKAKASQVCAAPEEIYDVELGSDVGRLLPSELIHLGEDTEVVLLDALADSRALQYAMRGSSEAGRGPLVLLIDESGSMHGSRGKWAKAALIALVRTAWEDNRVCAVVHWSSSAKKRVLRPGDAAGLLAAIKSFLDGGNYADLALSAGADLVDELQGKGDRGADVILVTDGVESMTARHEAAIDRIEARDARLWTVGIECPIEEGACIRARAEQYTYLDGDSVSQGEVGGLQGAVI